MMDTKVASADFFRFFQQEKEEILKSLDSIQNDNSDQQQSLIEGLTVRVQSLEKEMTNASIFLPTYDQRQCILTVKSLFEEIQKRKQPKQKFSFKNRKKIGGYTADSLTVAADTVTTTNSTTIKNNDNDFKSKQATGSNNMDDKKNSNTSSANLDLKSRSAAVIIQSIEDQYLDESYLIQRGHHQIHDLYIDNVKNSVIQFSNKQNEIASVHVKNIADSVLFIGKINGSLLIEKCENVIVIVGCLQYRMHLSNNCKVLLHVSSHPIIENCKDISFGFYSSISDEMKLNESSETCVISPKLPNKFNKVQDFNWLQPTQSPNWTVLDTDMNQSLLEKLKNLKEVSSKEYMKGNNPFFEYINKSLKSASN